MSPATRGRRQGAPAAALLSPDRPAPRIVDAAVGAIEETEVVDRPIATTSREEHERLQREHREWLVKMSGQTPAEMLGEEEPEAPEPEPVEDPVVTAMRVRMAQAEDYWRAVADMPADEPVYVVGVRAPRPQYHGLILAIGDVVPGAAYWPRLESWVRSGVITPAAQGVKSA